MKYFQTADLQRIRIPFMATLRKIQSINDHLHIFNDVPVFRICHNQELCTKDEILYIHGGGFVSGDYAGYRAFCQCLYDKTSMDLIFPVYPLCPENSMEDAVNSIVSVYMKMRRIYKRVWVIADSAGGNITLLALSRCKIVPYGVVLISPVTDLTCSWPQYNDDAMLDPLVTSLVFRLLVRDGISCINANLSKIENVHVFVGRQELLYYDSLKLRNIIKDILLYEYDNVIHSWPLFWDMHPEGMDAINKITNILTNQK